MIPTSVTVSLADLNLPFDADDSDSEVSEAVGDYLSDQYGFCHFGFLRLGN